MEATGDEVELDQDNGNSKFMKEIRLQGLQAFLGGGMEYLLKFYKKLSIITEEVKGDDRIGFVYGTKSIREEDVDKNAVQESCSVTDHDPLQKRTIAGNIETKKVVVDKKRRIRHYTNRQKILLVGEGDFSFASCLATAFGSSSNLIATSLDSKGHYDSGQKILLVGEGDFSFALCLASGFRFASNITATSLDSKDTVVQKYLHGENNIRNLKEKGATVIHQVDVHTMNTHPQLIQHKFDRIVFNFPHAGKRGKNVTEFDRAYIQRHRQIVSRFFKAARYMLTAKGEVHVTHKTTYPFNTWNIVQLARNAHLLLTREAKFDLLDYPGYVNKKGFGKKWYSYFPVGESSTFMFRSRRSLV